MSQAARHMTGVWRRPVPIDASVAEDRSCALGASVINRRSMSYGFSDPSQLTVLFQSCSGLGPENGLSDPDRGTLVRRGVVLRRRRHLREEA